MAKKIIIGALAAIGAGVVLLLALIIVLALSFGGTELKLGDKVGVVKVEGMIADSLETVEQIKDFARRDDIKAVVVRIDSPGGSVGPSQEIYREIQRLREHKRVVASMGAVAASGGYYIAAGAEKIVANPGTITGSIGVIAEFVNVQELLTKIGLKGDVIKSGKFKDAGSPLREMTPEERALIQGLLDDVHRQFVEAVARGRSLDASVVSALADGRVFSGEQAKKNGLVDELGGLSDAIEMVAKLSGLEPDPEVVYAEKPFGSVLRHLMQEGAEGALSGLADSFDVMYVARPFR
jgi:protease-4